MRDITRTLLAGTAAFTLSLTGLSFVMPSGNQGTRVIDPAQLSLLDLLDPTLASRSLCGEQGKERGGFFRPEFILALAPAAHADEPAEPGPQLWDGMGGAHMDVTTASDEAQTWFDQGIALTFGFNHWEAIRSFKKAQELDPTCAMCYWAEAFAHGPNINAPMGDSAKLPAFTAISMAQALKEGASKKERKLIEAMALRYSMAPDAKREDMDQAYSDAMGKLAKKYKDDLNISTFYAESLMDLSPWDYWERDFETPKPHIAKAIEAMEHVLAEDPEHPGATHLYIHLMEPSNMPERAEPYADTLAAQIPGAGHLVHMPGHTYFRIGRYLDSLKTNVEAVKADEFYLNAVPESGELYRFGYYPHNVHFVLVSAQMAGDGPTTVEFAHKLDGLIPLEMAKTAPWVAPIKASPMFAILQFGSDEEVAAIPEPSASLPYLRAVWHYVRGVKAAWAGRTEEALKEADAIRALKEGTEFGERYSAGEIQIELFDMAELMVRARVDQHKGDHGLAIEKSKQAAALQSLLTYTEPPLWYYPIEQTIGALHLQAGDATAATTAFRSSLIRHPNNAWSLYGMMKAQEAAGDSTASVTQMLFEKASASKDDIPLNRL